jgi:plastocyanin
MKLNPAIAALLISVAIPASAQARTVRIRMLNDVLNPTVAKAEVGDIVEWINDDTVAHTVTAWNGAFDVVIAANSQASIVLLKPGRVSYYSRFHPIMEGRLDVAR